MPAATSYPRLFLACAGLVYGGVFFAFLLWEKPGLGIGHFFYLAIALAAFANGPVGGALAGSLATGLYALGVVLNPTMPPTDVLTTSTAIRFVTFTAMGALIGWFARSRHVLVERLRAAAERDFLTNLLNARAFESALARRLDAGCSFVLILGDMDGLKQVNDREGHACGNDALRELADALVAQARREDDVARVGGDEFALLAAVTGTQDARGLLRRLETELAAQELKVSFGCAVYPDDGQTALELFHAADARLYDRKLVRQRLAGPAELSLVPALAEP